MDYFKLTRDFWDFAFENPEKIKPNHCALFLFIVEHCNRLGWKEKFGLPTTMTKDAIGIRSYNTYIQTLNDLVDFGLIILIERSKNQYSSNIVAISKNDKALDKALDKATAKHLTKQGESTVQSTGESICSIDKHITYNIEPINNENEKDFFIEEKNENDFDEKFLIPEMQKIWKEVFPKSFTNSNDYPFLKELAEKIHEWLQLQGGWIDNQNLATICDKWRHILQKMVGDNFYQSYDIEKTNKYFKAIIQFYNGNTKSNNKGFGENNRKVGVSEARTTALQNW